MAHKNLMNNVMIVILFQEMVVIMFVKQNLQMDLSVGMVSKNPKNNAMMAIILMEMNVRVSAKILLLILDLLLCFLY